MWLMILSFIYSQLYTSRILDYIACSDSFRLGAGIPSFGTPCDGNHVSPAMSLMSEVIIGLCPISADHSLYDLELTSYLFLTKCHGQVVTLLLHIWEVPGLILGPGNQLF
jgi:hypothetical protein